MSSYITIWGWDLLRLHSRRKTSCQCKALSAYLVYDRVHEALHKGEGSWKAALAWGLWIGRHELLSEIVLWAGAMLLSFRNRIPSWHQALMPPVQGDLCPDPPQSRCSLKTREFNAIADIYRWELLPCGSYSMSKNLPMLENIKKEPHRLSQLWGSMTQIAPKRLSCWLQGNLPLALSRWQAKAWQNLDKRTLSASNCKAALGLDNSEVAFAKYVTAPRWWSLLLSIWLMHNLSGE